MPSNLRPAHLLALWLVAILGLSMALAAPARAKDVTLAWDEDETATVVVSNYVVRYGTGSGDYSSSVEVGDQTTATVHLTPGVYYFTATARDVNGNESLPSDELVVEVDLDVPALSGVADGQSFNGGAFVLRAGDFGPDVTRVEYYANGDWIGQVDASYSATSWTPPQAGDYALSVLSYDAAGHLGVSTLTVHIVQPAVESLRQRAEDQAMELTVTGAPGRLQSVYVSENLSAWELLEARVNETGRMVVADLAAAQKGQRYYRVESQ